MTIKIVPVPSRQFKTYSMILGIAIGSFDAFLLLMKSFTDLHVMETSTALAINAVLGFLIVPAKLIMQNIPLTTEQKVDIVASAASQPMLDGQSDVQVHIEGEEVGAMIIARKDKIFDDL